MPLIRPGLHEEVVAILSDMILEGRLKPGTRIPELDLCRKLGISRTPLREALKVLASDQLVLLLPNRGAVVAPVTVDETVELFEVMEGLESLIGELAAKRIADAEIAELQAIHRKMLEDYREGRRREYFSRNQLVHRRLAEVTRNGPLAAVYVNYARKIMRVRYLANFSQLRWEESTKEHEEFMAALAARDGILLARLLREHLRRTAASVIAAMEQSDLFAPRGQPNTRGGAGAGRRAAKGNGDGTVLRS